MKLTEAQLKRIIAEEVQTAIDEGIFDWFRTSGDRSWVEPGSVSDRISKAAGKARSAVGRLGSAFQKGAEGAADIANAGLSLPSTLDQAAVDAIYAARRGRDRKLIEKTSDLVNQLARKMEEIKALGDPDFDSILINYFETLAGSIGTSVYGLPGIKHKADKKAGVTAVERGSDSSNSAKDASRRANMRDARISAAPSATSATSLEEQADTITETIIKRITQKR